MNKKIFKAIKKYNNIVIARHINADPDAMGSSFALKEAINATFKEKNVFLAGVMSTRFSYMGRTNRFIEYDHNEDYLLICLDTPDKKRLDIDTIDRFAYKIKIDHHPHMETYCDLELIDDNKSSASEMVYDLIKETGLKMTKKVAEYLFYGIIADTGRFLFSNTTPYTMNVIASLINDYKLDTSKMYYNLYKRPINEFKLQGYMASNMKVTKNGVGYIKITSDIMDKFNLDSASSGDAINEFNNVIDFVVWISAIEDKKNNNIRVSIRSRGPEINKVAEKYHGGGHPLASGTRLLDFKEVDSLIEDLDKVCEKYQGVENDEDN